MLNMHLPGPIKSADRCLLRGCCLRRCLCTRRPTGSPSTPLWAPSGHGCERVYAHLRRAWTQAQARHLTPSSCTGRLPLLRRRLRRRPRRPLRRPRRPRSRTPSRPSQAPLRATCRPGTSGTSFPTFSTGSTAAEPGTYLRDASVADRRLGWRRTACCALGLPPDWSKGWRKQETRCSSRQMVCRMPIFERGLVCAEGAFGGAGPFPVAGIYL